jgi:hypothetical protein
MYADPQQKILLPTRPTRIDDTTVVYDSRRKKELFNLKNQQSFWLVPNVVISPVQLASGLGFAKSGNTFSFYNAHAQKLWGTNFADIRRLDSALFVVQPKPNQFQIWNTFGTPINHHKYSKLAFSPEKKSVAFKQAEVFEVFNSKGQLLTHEKCFARTPYTTTLTEISFYNRTAFFNTKNELFEYE